MFVFNMYTLYYHINWRKLILKEAENQTENSPDPLFNILVFYKGKLYRL